MHRHVVWRLRTASAVLLTLALAALPGIASAAPPSYLADMPTVAQVEAKIHGSDSADTAVRQSAAFGQLCWIVRALSAGGEFGNTMAPEETAQCAVYQKAASDIAKAASVGLPAFGHDSWVMRTQRFSTDDARKEVLNEFSPKIRELYEARMGRDRSARDARVDDTSRNGGILVAIVFLFPVLGLVLGAVRELRKRS
jgi:hypothetical protein